MFAIIAIGGAHLFAMGAGWPFDGDLEPAESSTGTDGDEMGRVACGSAAPTIAGRACPYLNWSLRDTVRNFGYAVKKGPVQEP